ncbi:phosphoadenosine phosphosulfate reductase family protein [Thermogladius calderae]|nr:phosphoadenosine phosphosulfate reductase family protein [Thermogladius calderae]
MSKPMYVIATRASSDKDALEHVVERFYPGWGIQVVSLGGVRSSEALAEGLQGLDGRALYKLYIANKEDAESGVLPSRYSPTTVVHVVGKARVRNMRLEEIRHEVEKARAKLRLRLYFENGSYKFAPTLPIARPVLEEPEVYHDIMAFRVPEFAKSVVGLEPGWYIALRDVGGRHVVFSRGEPAGFFKIRDNLGVEPYNGRKPESVNIVDLAEANREFVLKLVEATLDWVKSLGDYDHVLVPWSGGKDSTMALYLALKLFGRSRVSPVFVDIDVDFPENKLFVEEVSSQLGIDLVVKRLELKPHLLVNGLPEHSNRWCSRLKVSKLEEAYGEVCSGGARCLVLVGDRDVESESRSSKPPFFTKGNLTYAYPLKQWSTLLLQVATVVLGVPLNPLYEQGFYRLGCYICPSLRGWEVELIKNSPRLNWLLGEESFREFLKKREFTSNS